MRRAVILPLLAVATLGADVTPSFSSLHPRLLDEVKSIRLTGGVPTSLAVNPTGTMAAVGTGAGSRVLVIDLEASITGGVVVLGELRRTGALSIAFGRGNVLALGTKAGEVELRTGEKFEEVRTVKLNKSSASPVRKLLFSRSGKILAAVDGSAISLIDTAGARLIGRSRHRRGSEGEIAMTFDRAERRLIFALDDGRGGILDTRDARELQRLERPTTLPKSLILSKLVLDPSGSRIAFRGEKVVIFDTRRGKSLFQLIQTDETLEGLAFADDGGYLIGHSKDEMQVWNTSNGWFERVIWVMSKTLKILAIASDSNRIVTVGRFPSGQMVLRIFGVRSDHTKRPGFLGVTFAPGGTRGGARVNSVLLGTPAQGALMQPGDIVEKIGGKTVKTDGDAIKALKSHKEGEEVEIELVREGERETFKVTLGARIE